MAATNAAPDNKVSTLGVNTEFVVGETALCYEPDPTKAKMLYEAKVFISLEGIFARLTVPKV